MYGAVIVRVTIFLVSAFYLQSLEAYDALAKPVPTGSQENNPWVFRVPSAFNLIPVRADEVMGIAVNNVLKAPRYTYSANNKFKGIWGAQNHFQSVHRLPVHLGLGDYMVVAGSDPHEPQAQLFIVQFGSQGQKPRYTKNVNKGVPAVQDKMRRAIKLSEEKWHVGGLDMTGRFLAVPLSDDTSSKIVFYDMKDPEKPVLMKCEHKECIKAKKSCLTLFRKTANARAVAITKLIDGKFLLAVYTDGQSGTHRGLDFYVSKTISLYDGFDLKNRVHLGESEIKDFKQKRTFETINFVNDFDHSLYLVGSGNTSVDAPLKAGMDYLNLFEVKVFKVTEEMIASAKKNDPKSTMAAMAKDTLLPKVTFVKEKQMYCKQRMCNFNAGASLFVPDQQHLYVYSVPHWLDKKGSVLWVSQFSSIYKSYPA